jgi:hypothetical protein
MKTFKRVVAYDCETHYIEEEIYGYESPAAKLVVASWAEEERCGLLNPAQAIGFLFSVLEDKNALLVGANIVFDLAVAIVEAPSLIDLVFEAFEDGRIRCVQVRQKLLDIAKGELDFRRDADGNVAKTLHSLDALAKYWLNRSLDKSDDSARYRYAELDGIPIEQWPEKSKIYAIDDAVATLDVYDAQERWIVENFDDGLPNEIEQNRAAWALHLMRSWGVRTDVKSVTALERELRAENDEAVKQLQKSGIYRANGSKDTKLIGAMIEKIFRERAVSQLIQEHPELQDRWRDANGQRLLEGKKEIDLFAWVAEEYDDIVDATVPRTPTGKVSLTKEVLEETKDPKLILLAESGEGSKLLSTYVPILKKGTMYPIHARYNVLVSTGRTSCAGPNMQNPPRKPGFRECFVPRYGWLYIGVDYDTIELRALAQVCLWLFGWSTMADALREDKDLHLMLAAQIIGISYDEAVARLEAGDKEVEDMRQVCKVANFGFPGGMSAETFVAYAAGYSKKVAAMVTPKVAAMLHEGWKATWREMKPYFDVVSDIVGPSSSGIAVQPRSGRIRGGVNFCQLANGNFQGLTADGVKQALWDVARECYLRGTLGGKDSPLFGTRPTMFIHDEIIAETFDPIGHPEVAHAAAWRLSARMIESMKLWIPDIPIKAKPALMRRWYKGAKQIVVDGFLRPSRPVKSYDAAGHEKTTWVHDDGGELLAA